MRSIVTIQVTARCVTPWPALLKTNRGIVGLRFANPTYGERRFAEFSELCESATPILQKLRMRLPVSAISAVKCRLSPWHFLC